MATFVGLGVSAASTTGEQRPDGRPGGRTFNSLYVNRSFAPRGGSTVTLRINGADTALYVVLGAAVT